MSATVGKALSLLELLSKYDGPVRMAELSRAAGMNKSTTYRLLEIMAQKGYVAQEDANGRYMLTSKMWEIGFRAFNRTDLRALAKPYLREIVEQLGETAVFATSDGREVILLEKVDSAQPLQTLSPLGSRSPMHASSLGKAFLMARSDGEILAMTDLEAFTEHTVTDPKQLLEEIAQARLDGVALGVNEYRTEVAGVAAPVIGADGLTHGVIGISLPSYRMVEANIETMKSVIREAAKAFSIQLGFRSSEASASSN